MTTTETTERPLIDLAAYHALARAAGWRFVCPRCGNVATPDDFRAIGANPLSAAEECIGRSDASDVECDWAAYGLLGTTGLGLRVRFPDGTIAESFAIACTDRRAAMDVDGWGYSDCELPAQHPGGHKPGAIVHDGGVYRASTEDEAVAALAERQRTAWPAASGGGVQ